MVKRDFEENKRMTIAFLESISSDGLNERKQKIYNKLQDLNFWMMENFVFGKFKDSASFFRYTLMKYAINL